MSDVVVPPKTSKANVGGDYRCGADRETRVRGHARHVDRAAKGEEELGPAWRPQRVSAGRDGIHRCVPTWIRSHEDRGTDGRGDDRMVRYPSAVRRELGAQVLRGLHSGEGFRALVHQRVRPERATLPDSFAPEEQERLFMWVP